MKQAEMLDLILRDLYNHKYDGRYYSIAEIGQRLHFPDLTLDMCRSLGFRLRDEGYVKIVALRHDIEAILTSQGIDYTEGNSFSRPGEAITNIYHMNISNSPNANIVNQSANVNISIQTTNAAEIITKMKDFLTNDQTTPVDQKERLSEGIEEIEAVVKAGKKPKLSISSLIELAGSSSEMGLLAIELGKLFGLLS